VPELEGTKGSPDQPSTVHAVATRCAPGDLTRFHPDDQDRPGSVLWRQFGGPTLRTVPGGHHNLLHDPDLPWTDTPWTALGHEALTFFSKQLQPAPRKTSTQTPSPTP
jgi:hypothetical protein